MEQPEVLRSFLISFHHGQAVLPQSIVVESLPFATPLRIEHAPPWVVGAILWRARTTPLVNVDALVEGTSAASEAHSRIVVLNALGNDPKLRNYCVLATVAPQLIELERSIVALDEEENEILRPPGISRHIRVNGEPTIILDLDFIEGILSEIVLRKAQSSFNARKEFSAVPHPSLAL
jgi:chemosensory pili system protein ChpC